MQSNNRILVASAGSGKTTHIVSQAVSLSTRSALITYTNNSTNELVEKARQICSVVPEQVVIGTWYTFLLSNFVRPYQRFLYEPRIDDIEMVNGRSAPYSKASDIPRHYFRKSGKIYLDKISKFACSIIEVSDGMPLRRIEQIFSELFIDEVQDLAGYDLDLVEYLLKADLRVQLVGDIRQATYKTNALAKNKKFAGTKIIEKFSEWEKAGFAVVEYQSESHRCIQEICDYADALYPELPPTISQNKQVTGHDGVFAIREVDAERYFQLFSPQPLRLTRSTKVPLGNPLNFGEAKGFSFDRVLIYPHSKLLDVICSDDRTRLGTSEQTKAKVYVAITRARNSVAFVVPDNVTPASIPVLEL